MSGDRGSVAPAPPHRLLVRLPGLAVVLLLLLAGCDAGAPAVSAHDAWSRPTMAPGGTPDPSVPGVVYLTLRNDGDGDDRLLGASSPDCRRVELHRTTTIDGRSRMESVEGGVPLPAGGTVELAPGGLHLMLIGLTRGLVAGGSIAVTLELQSGELTLAARVRRP